MRFWVATVVLLLVLLNVLEAAKSHAHHNKSKAQHKPVAHKHVAHKHVVHKKKAAHHGPAHHTIHHHVQKKKSKNSHKKSHRGPTGTLRMSKHMSKTRVRAIRAGTLCENLATNCGQVEGLCGAKEFASILIQFCKMTCGFCKPPQNMCKDRFSKCKSWKDDGFCTHPIFPMNLRRSMCAKSCGQCGGKTNCKLGPNKLLKECLSTTCKQKSMQKKKECKEYCKTHKGQCGGKKPQPDCSKPADKFKPQCLAYTCISDEEKKNPSKECKEWCAKDENKAVCGAAEKDCTVEANKFDDKCIADTCIKEEADKRSPECTKFCTANPPACDKECAKDSPKRYEDKCLPATCIRPEEIGDKANDKCKEWCKKPGNEDKCKGGDKPAPAGDDCANAAKKFTEECLPKTCAKADQKNEASCKLYCGRQQNDAAACTGVTPIKCELAADEKKPECMPHYCRKDDKKTENECQQHCAAKPEEKPECVGVTPVSDTGGKNCEGKAADARFDENDCWQYSCLKLALKTEDKCKEHCNTAPSTDNFACARVESGDLAACNGAGNEYKDDTCKKHTCRKTAKKGDNECVEFCELNKKDKACIGVLPKANAACDPNDKKFTAACISYTCRKPVEKTTPECENFCLNNAADDACAL